jgi:hypothetical protein
VRHLTDWYTTKARAFLERVQSEKLRDFDKDLEQVQAAQKRVDQELAVCFLGNSGVGKSTLVNALVADNKVILPAGGIGPLTAQALVVAYGEKPRFEVEYHTPKNLWNLVFALERSLDSGRKKAALKGDGKGQDEFAKLIETEVREDVEEATSTANPQRTKFEEYKKQAQLLVTGNQDGQADLAYLVDCLRTVAGKERVWGTQLRGEDEERVRQLQSVLNWASGEGGGRSMSADEPDFFSALQDHASGFLAPLIKELRVFWNSPLLAQGVSFVDLPGLGISGDVYQAVTSRWVRERAQAIVLVVEPRGISEVNADLLRTSRAYASRLL